MARGWVRSRWVSEPTQGYHEQPVKHLFDPGHHAALCGKVEGPGWGKSFDALRCERCVDLEETR